MMQAAASVKATATATMIIHAPQTHATIILVHMKTTKHPATTTTHALKTTTAQAASA
jgi:hypothetical protein